MFIGMTNPDNADKMTTSARPNSVPDGTWPTKYGSKKMYSDTNSSGNNNPTKIAIENAMYFGFEKTSFTTFNLNVSSSLTKATGWTLWRNIILERLPSTCSDHA